MRMIARSIWVLSAFSVLQMALTGCATPALEPGPSYPASASRYGSLDIQVYLQGRELVLTNTTALALPAGRLWLNEWYSAATPEIAIGQTLRLPLTSFRDEHGQTIRGGGFFASEAPEEILLVEMAAAGELYGLIVVRR